MRTIKRYEGYFDGLLCYEWEVKQRNQNDFVFLVNGCSCHTSQDLGSAMWRLWDSIKDFLINEDPKKINIKGV
jgi:hypothetical protein